jgi:hypothetical protein
MPSLLKRSVPHALAVAAFLAITLAYFLPLLSGQQISQHDIMQWQGMSKEIVDFREKHGQEPLWTNSMFGGMPAYQISVVYSANLVRHLDRVLSLGLPPPANYLFLSLLCFYILLLVMKLDVRSAVAGAIAFGLSSYHLIILIAGHNSKAHAIAYMPLVVAGVLLAFQNRLLLGGALTAVALALELYANHLQITYYLFIVIGLLVLFHVVQAVRGGRVVPLAKQGAVLLFAALLGVMCNVTGLWATYEYGKYSTRSQSELAEKKVSTGLDKDYALEYSYGVAETFTLFIPRFSGGASSEPLDDRSATFEALVRNGVGAQQARAIVATSPLYFGDMRMTSGPPYAGAVVVFLFVFGLFVVKGPLKWWLATATALSVMLAWGKNFMPLTELFFDHFPGYNKFRAVSMLLVVAEFTLPLLALLAFRQAGEGGIEKKRLLKWLQYSFYITGGFCALTLAMPGLFSDFTARADAEYLDYFQRSQLPDPGAIIEGFREDRRSAVRMDALRSLFFVTAAAALLWAWFKGKLKSWTTAAFLLAMLLLVDLWPVAKRYLNKDHFVRKSKVEKPFTPTQADLQILQDPDPNFRVMNTTVSTFNDATTSYFHKSIGGYHGAKLKRYQELVEYQLSRNNQAVLNMLNTKYFIFRPQSGGEPVAQRNPDACGPAWFVSEYRLVANADSELTALSNFDPKQTAIVDRRYEDRLENLAIRHDSAAFILLTKYAPNHLEYEAVCASPQLAVFSEIFYDKGWQAFVDGQPAPHFRVNYVLRGMVVPAGRHRIDFRFEPAVYRTGETISLAASALTLVLFFGVVFLEARKKTQPAGSAARMNGRPGPAK